MPINIAAVMGKVEQVEAKLDTLRLDLNSSLTDIHVKLDTLAGLGLQGNSDPEQPIGAAPTLNLFAAGLPFLGFDEEEHNAQLLEHFGRAGIQCDPAAQAWCAAYADLCLYEAGFPIVGSLTARDFFSVGTRVDGEPQVGDLACWRNHVAIFAGYADASLLATLETPFKVRSVEEWEKVRVSAPHTVDSGISVKAMVKGGNQSDEVNISPQEWYDKYSKFLGYRRV